MGGLTEQILEAAKDPALESRIRAPASGGFGLLVGYSALKLGERTGARAPVLDFSVRSLKRS